MKLLNTALPSLLITLPRTAATYPLYAAASICLLGGRSAYPLAYIRILALYLLLVASFTLRYFSQDVSITAFFLELILITPLLLFASGFRPIINEIECLQSIRFINLVCAISSMLNLFDEGFPFLLPYIDYPPDAYFGTFGVGGARIVTIFGLVGLLFEATTTSRSRYRLIWSVVAAINFAVPSYLIGTVCGIGALIIIFIRRPILLLILTLLSAPVGLYLILRLSGLNSIISDILGYHPKVFAHLLVYELLSRDLTNLFLGTGLGQFTSSPQVWASDAFQRISTQSAPNLPGLHTSSFHREYVEPISSISFINSSVLSSAANKPYTGVTTLIAEMGLSSLIIIYLFLKQAVSICITNKKAIAFFVFFVLLNIVDQWIDNLWLGYCLLLASAFYAQRPPTLGRLSAAA